MQKTTQTAIPIYPMPFVRVELAVLTVIDGALHVLLGQRKGEPHSGQWALPGGVVRIDLDADLEAAALRVASERLGTVLPGVTQLCAVGGQLRDPRAPWALSVVYRSMLAAEQLQATPGKRLDALRWVPADVAAQDDQLAFDHTKLIGNAARATRTEFDNLQFPPGFLADTFTLSELQSVSEAVLGRRLDKSSFRRRLADRGCLQEVPGEMKTGTFRPAQLYRLGA
jgi:ADP-ribose pyrophosphatase YjhB (NUDIX family)